MGRRTSTTSGMIVFLFLALSMQALAAPEKGRSTNSSKEREGAAVPGGGEGAGEGGGGGGGESYAVVVRWARGGNQMQHTAHVFQYSWQGGHSIFPRVFFPANSSSYGSASSLIDFAATSVPKAKRNSAVFEVFVAVGNDSAADPALSSFKALAEKWGFQAKVSEMQPEREAALRWLAVNYQLDQHRLKKDGEAKYAVVSVEAGGAQVAATRQQQSDGGEKEAGHDLGIAALGGAAFQLTALALHDMGLDGAIERHLQQQANAKDDPCRQGSPGAAGHHRAKSIPTYHLCRASVLLASPELAKVEARPGAGSAVRGHHHHVIITGSTVRGVVLVASEPILEALGLGGGGGRNQDSMLTVGRLEGEVAKHCEARTRQRGRAKGGNGLEAGGLDDEWGCFRAAHAALFLASYFPDATPVRSLQKTSRSQVDWPLGAMLKRINEGRGATHHRARSGDAGHSGGVKGGGKKKIERRASGGMKAMAMAVVCGVIFVTTLALQSPPHWHSPENGGCEESGRGGASEQAGSVREAKAD